ncbi:MAG: NADH-quinone oxidoreductase subunit H [Fretibacterium sp.]|nr:NADH-quinone oxidoreductase subunit H [Fretibacterium sp.]
MIFTFFLKVFAGVSQLILLLAAVLIFEGLGCRLTAFLQGRRGPSLFQPAFDLAKLANKAVIVPEGASPWSFHATPSLALSCVLMSLLYIPMGRFPAVLRTEGDVILIFFLLAAGIFASVLGGLFSGNPFAVIGGGRVTATFLSGALTLGVVITAMAWTAWRLGLPGMAFSLETFVARPAWSELGALGKFALLCLGLACAGVIPVLSGLGPFALSGLDMEGAESCLIEYGGFDLALFRLASTLRFFVLTCLFVVFFFPASTSSMWGWSGFGAAVVDFFLFGLKVFFVQMTFYVGAAYYEGLLKNEQTVRFCLLLPLPLSISGTLLLSFDFLLR